MGIYVRVDVPIIPVTTAGIYYNSTDGIISLSSDGTSWTTISDKNLGASVVYEDGDTLSESNCGGYFQWGNIHMFPYTGPTSTTNSKNNPLGYGPGTTPGYWNYSTFITSSDGWMTYAVPNLWGETTNTDEARKGPCDTGYHIPSLTEWADLITLGTTISAWNSSDGSGLKDYLFMPYSGRTRYDSVLNAQGTRGFYYTTKSNNDNSSAYLIKFNGTAIEQSLENNATGACIRPFKNDAVQPDSTRTVLYQPS